MLSFIHKFHTKPWRVTNLAGEKKILVGKKDLKVLPPN
jgi:hypothetical protein